MPTYIYECKNCGKEIELYNIPVKERHEQKCVKCKNDLLLVISPNVNITVKGYSARNSYGLHETVGESMDKADKRLGREPQGEKINERVLERKARKKMPRLVSG